MQTGWTGKGYEIRALIDEGGFGRVYRASQPAIGRDVAIKVILPKFANQPDFIRRFETEAQLIARLEHPHIVPLYDYWRDPEGAYLVMRYLSGGSLRTMLRKGPVSLHAAARLVEQVASALYAAHRAGVVHRDLKPENVLLDDPDDDDSTLSLGNAYLTDFGIAKNLMGDTAENEESDAMLTGSPAYIAPEQVMSRDVSPQTDIYCLGIILYELLTGMHPFHDVENSGVLLVKQMNEPLPPLYNVRPDLPEALNVVIQRATQKDPQERFGSAKAMASALWMALRHVNTNRTPEKLVIVPEMGSETINVADIITPATKSLQEVINPYKGLRAFEAVDAADFFGREALTQQLVDRLLEDDALARFLAVVGPSGSGKSSVVKAGLLPALRKDAIPGSEHWFIVETVPGTRPLQELERALLSVAVARMEDLSGRLRRDPRGLLDAARALLPADSELLLVIDQFEETFTQAEDPEEADQYLELLATAVTDTESPVRVIVTLRADFYDRPLLHPQFSGLISKRTQVVVPLTREELRRAITAPAEHSGILLEPTLVQAIVRDVSQQPGMLPLLQYALTELFERRDGRRITLEAYEQIGGTLGALARRATELYEMLPVDAQGVARQMFLRLVTLGDGTEDTRRRVMVGELTSISPEYARVIDVFGKFRLLTFDRDPATRAPTVEVAHEAIIREWSLLRGWLNESREDVRQQRRLAAAVVEWLEHDREASYLLRGAQLTGFEAWAGATDIALGEDERGLLEASIAARRAQEQAEAAREAKEREQELRVQRIQRRLLIGMTIAAFGAAILALFAFDQRSQAEQSAGTAVAAQGLAEVEADNAATSAAIAQRRADELQSASLAEDADALAAERNTDLALALALAANEIPNPPVLAQRVLARIAPVAPVRVINVGAPVATFAILNGDLFAVTGLAVQQIDGDSGEIIQSLDAQHGEINAVAADGTTVLVGAEDGTLTLWDGSAGGSPRTLTGTTELQHTEDVLAVALDTEVQRALSGSRDQTLIVWDLAAGTPLLRLIGHSGRVTAAAFEGVNEAISGGADGVLIAWDLTTGQPMRRFEGGHTDTVTSFTRLDVGETRWLISTGADNRVIVWNYNTGVIVQRLTGEIGGHNERVTSVAAALLNGRPYLLSASGNPFAGAAPENALILWELVAGQFQPVRRYTGHSAAVTQVALIESQGRLLAYSSSADGTLRQWAASSDVTISAAQVEANTAGAAYSDFALVVGTYDAALTARYDWDGALLGTLTGTQDITHNDVITALAISADGARTATGSDDDSLILWDTTAGAPLRQWRAHTNNVTALAFSPDGRFVASGSRDRSVILWDVNADAPAINFGARHTNTVLALAFSPDGSRIVSASADRSLIVWDTAAGAELLTLRGHTGEVYSAAYSADGRSIVSGSVDQTLIVWDATTGEIVRRFGETGERHTDFVTAVAFSPDGSEIVSGSVDRTVRLWDVASGQPIRVDTGYGDTITGLRFSADGGQVYVVSRGGDLRVLPASPAAYAAWVRDHRAVRALTCEEQTFYGLGACP